MTTSSSSAHPRFSILNGDYEGSDHSFPRPRSENPHGLRVVASSDPEAIKPASATANQADTHDPIVPVVEIHAIEPPPPAVVNLARRQVDESSLIPRIHIPPVPPRQSRSVTIITAGPAPSPAPETIRLPHEEASGFRKVTTLIFLTGAPFVLCPATIVGTVAMILHNMPVAITSIAVAIIWIVGTVEAYRYRKNWRQRLTRTPQN